MKSKYLKGITTFLMVIAFILPLYPQISVAAEVMQPTSLNGVNIERKLNYLVAYTDKFGSGSTKTDDKGIEAVVNSDGIVTAVGGNNNDIPNGGFVLSGSSTKKSFIENSIKVGYGIYLDEEAKTVTIIPEGYSPFSSSTIEYTSINSTRYENTLVIFNGADHKTTTGTNVWGYEVVVNADGYIISVGGNNNIIPEGGLVLSAIGTKKATLTEIAQIGDSVKIDNSTKIVTISYSKENAVEAPRLILESWKKKYNDAKSLYKNLDYTAIQKTLTTLENEFNNIKTAIEADNMLTYTVSQNKFDKICGTVKSQLVESPAVEARALWIRPMEKTVDAVKKTVKEIYDYGFNIICIETLYDNTMITPMPEGSLLSQNPSFNGFDVLAAYIDECHKYGIEVHSWMPVYRVAHEGSTNSSLGLNVLKPDWLNIANTGINYVQNEYGKSYFLNPALPEVQDYLLSVYRYILEKYSLDGFQLDYIRYPDLVDGIDYGYDDYTCSQFIAKYNADPRTIKSGDAVWNTWVEFRAQFVTDLVLKVKALKDEIRPDIYLSCDVAPSYSESLSRMKQDTTTWISKPYIEMVYPMAYGTVDRVISSTTATVSLAGDEVFSYIGVGDYGAESLFDQITAIRDNGADGVAFFAYAQFVAGKYESIPETIFADRAVSPTFCSKKALIAQLKYIKERIKNIIVPFGIDGAAELDALCSEIDTLNTSLTDSSITNCKSSIDKLVTDLTAVLNDKVTDENAKNALNNDLRIVKKVVKLSKDDVKAVYYANHPLPSMYELSEEDENISTDTNSGDNSKGGVELNLFEKIVRGIAIGIITFSILGLPLYFVLDARKKRLLREYEENKNNKDIEDKDDKTNKDK